jgi:hypothetical protein
MIKEHHVIYVPGLNDTSPFYELLIHRWSIYGIVPHVYRVGWHDGETSFNPKLKRLVGRVDEHLVAGHYVSLVGGSAGGSAVLNTLLEESKITAVVNLCGRLKAGTDVFPSLEMAAKSSPAFKDSVLTFERKEPSMSSEQRKKVLNLIPLWDEVVPRSTVPLKGATNRTLPCIEHMFSGLLGMTILSPMVINFIREKENES